jgi:hypothetical protein
MRAILAILCAGSAGFIWSQGGVGTEPLETVSFAMIAMCAVINVVPS